MSDVRYVIYIYTSQWPYGLCLYSLWPYENNKKALFILDDSISSDWFHEKIIIKFANLAHSQLCWNIDNIKVICMVTD